MAAGTAASTRSYMQFDRLEMFMEPKVAKPAIKERSSILTATVQSIET